MARVPSARATSTRPLTCLQVRDRGGDCWGHTTSEKQPPLRRFTVTYTRLSTESLSLMEWRHRFQLPTAEWTYSLSGEQRHFQSREQRLFVEEEKILSSLQDVSAKKSFVDLQPDLPAILGSKPHGGSCAGVVFGFFASVFRVWRVRCFLFGLTRVSACRGRSHR